MRCSDGNKRTAALAPTVFLDLNGYELYEANETELADVQIALGSGEIEQGDFFAWVCNHATPKPRSPALAEQAPPASPHSTPIMTSVKQR